MMQVKHLSTLEKKRKKKPKKKQLVVQVDNLSKEKTLTPISLGEYFPPGFFNNGTITICGMVSCYENPDEDEAK